MNIAEVDVHQRPMELLHPIQIECMKEIVSERIDREISACESGKPGSTVYVQDVDAFYAEIARRKEAL